MTRWGKVAAPIATAMVVAIAVVVALAEGAHKCASCGGAIEGEYFHTDGRYYHPEHFVCDQCGDPIEGAYVTRRDHQYHVGCFRDNVAVRCAVCRGVIRGEYFIDYWENAYHKRHRRDLEICDYCDRVICDAISGGGRRYSDGRHTCAVCRKTAVTEKRALRLLLREVADRLEAEGVSVDARGVDLHLVDLPELRCESGRDSDRLTGFTDFEETRSIFGRPRKRRVDIYLLWGLPRMDAAGTLAHELMHVWQFTAGRLKNDPAFSEGSCNYASFLVLDGYTDPMAAYGIWQLDRDVDSVYGRGYRRVKMLVRSRGVDGWLEALRSGRSFPDGF